MSHAKFAPSSMARTVACPGSVNMSDGIQDEVTQDSMEGDAVHELIEKVLSEFKMRNSAYVVHWNTFIDDPASNGVIYNEEMVDAAQCYVDYVMSIVTTPGSMHIEEKVYMPNIHKDNDGTPDCWWVTPDNKRLHVFDFKYGHKSVSAFENWQAMDYIDGAFIQHMGSQHIWSENKMNYQFTIHIVQPRCYYDHQGPYRTWDVDMHTMRTKYIPMMSEACRIAEEPDAPVITGPQCENCPGRIKCNALTDRAAGAIDLSHQPSPLDPMSDNAIGYEMRVIEMALDRLSDRKAAIESDIIARLSMGIHIPGYRMENGVGKRKWSVSDEEVINLGHMYGVDLQEKKAVSPAQAEKILVDASVIKDYYHKPSTGLKLKHDDGTKAKLAFGEK